VILLSIEVCILCADFFDAYLSNIKQNLIMRNL
jgi:hypothetical protein